MYPVMKVGLYHYMRRGSFFAIYQCTECRPENGASVSLPTGERYRDREEARRRVYELNGWKPRETR